MKVSNKIFKKVLPAFLLVVAACLLVVVAIQLLTPGDGSDWAGVHTINTTTPTLTLYPDQGWWTSMPTAPAVPGIPSPSITPTVTP